MAESPRDLAKPRANVKPMSEEASGTVSWSTTDGVDNDIQARCVLRAKFRGIADSIAPVSNIYRQETAEKPREATRKHSWKACCEDACWRVTTSSLRKLAVRNRIDCETRLTQCSGLRERTCVLLAPKPSTRRVNRGGCTFILFVR